MSGGLQETFLKKLEGEERKKAIDEPGKSWRQWAREDLARYWYVVLCLFIDVMFFIQFVQNFFNNEVLLNLIYVVFATAALIPMIYIELHIYRRLFPERF
ncbi:MAG: hypothetical protein QXN66_02880 [Thermoplasmatales archaeon]